MDSKIKEECSAVPPLREAVTTLLEEVRMDGVITRRHIDVVAASLRRDLHNVAELLAALDAKIESIRDSR